MKKIIYALLGLIIVAVIAITFAFDPIGKKYAQEYAQNLLKTSVSISQFDSSFWDKSLNIDFVEVQNPPGFKNKNAFSLDHFFLRVDDETTADFIVIDELRFEGIEFTLEQDGSSVNLTKLIDALKSRETSSSTKTLDSDSAKRIKINTFKVEDVVLKVDTQFLQTTVNVPNIVTHNFGGNAGTELSQIGKQIVAEILQNLKKTLAKEGIEAGKKKIKETLIRKIGDKLGIGGLQEKINLDNIKDSVGSGYDSVKDAVKEQFDDKLKDKAKDLLKGFGF